MQPSLIIPLCLAGPKQTQLSHIFLLEIKLKHIHTPEANDFISASTAWQDFPDLESPVKGQERHSQTSIQKLGCVP